VATAAQAIEQQTGRTRKTERAAGLYGSAHLLLPALRPTDLGSGREFTRKVWTPSGNYQLLQLAPWPLTDAKSVRVEFLRHKLLKTGAGVDFANFISARKAVWGR